MASVVIRVKRTRDEASLDDFVLREATAPNELVAKLKRVDLAAGGDGGGTDEAVPVAVGTRSRVFRRVGTVTEAEAERLLQNPSQMDAHVRESVKQQSLRELTNRERAEDKQQQKLKVSRMRVLQEKRMGLQRVLDVGVERVGGKVRRIIISCVRKRL